MKVWLVTIGEPIPVGFAAHDRLLRTGSIANCLAARGHEVTWWTSTFDHFRKRHYFDRDTTLQMNKNLIIKLIYGHGYKRNVSIRRILDHRAVSKKYADLILKEKKPDIIVSSLPTIDLSFESVKYGREFQIPVVLDMRDMWPEILVDTLPRGFRGIGRFLLASAFRKARQACEGATAITGITDAFLDWGLKKARRERSSKDRSFPLGYTSDPPLEQDIRRAETFWDSLGVTEQAKGFHVCFIGTIGRQFDLNPIIAAARKIRHEKVPMKFIMCGYGDRYKSLKEMTDGDKSILFPGRIDAAQIHVLMRRSCVGLDPLPDRYDFLATINNKAIEYLSSGLPIVSSPNRGVLAEMIEKHKCGLSYPTGDSDGLTEKLLALYQDRKLLSELSCNAAALFTQKFAVEKVNDNFIAHLEALVSV